MSYNPEKMGKLILSECESIEEKCDGYREEIRKAIIAILKAEKEHRAQRTRIQQHIDEACHSPGDFLMKVRNIETTTKEAAK